MLFRNDSVEFGSKRAIARAQHLVRVCSARLCRAATRIGGDDGAALAWAFVDMVHEGHAPFGWPIAALIELLDTASDSDRQSERLLADLRSIEAELSAAAEADLEEEAA